MVFKGLNVALTCQEVWYQSRYSKNGHIDTSNCCTYQLREIPVHQFPNMGNHHLRKVQQSGEVGWIVHLPDGHFVQIPHVAV